MLQLMEWAKIGFWDTIPLVHLQIDFLFYKVKHLVAVAGNWAEHSTEPGEAAVH